MIEFFTKIVNQFKDFYHGLTTPRKLAVVTIAVLLFVGFGILIASGNREVYETLMTNLSPEDSTRIVRFLREKNLNYVVRDNGRTIQVSPENIFDIRLELSSLGMPDTSVVGYEILDKQNFGTTSAIQNLNIKRAKEGELMRTIASLKPVKSARVHLNIPKKSAFLEKSDPPSASIVVELHPGFVLEENQIKGITHMVASSVEGLTSERVVILDQRGKQLTKNADGEVEKYYSEMLDFKNKVEGEYRTKVIEMLEKIVGPGMVDAQVSAEIDFEQVHETQVTYDANATAVRSAQKVADNLKGSRPVGGVPGAQSQLPNNNPPGAEATQPPALTQDVNKSRDLTNYEVPQNTKYIKHPYAKIRTMSVAVLLNQHPVEETGADGTPKTVYKSWSKEELNQFSNLVSSALGLRLDPDEDGKKIDTLKIENMNFHQEDVEKANQDMANLIYKQNIGLAIRYSVIGIAVLMFFWFVVRPFIAWVTENTTDDITDYLPQTLEELEKAQEKQELPGMDELMPDLQKIDPVKAEGEYVRDRLVEIIMQDPEKAATVVKDMIHDRYKGKKAGDKDKKEKKAEA